MEFVLIIVMAAIYALVHIANGWVFHLFEISAHISWIYLPAFLRLFFILVLGRVNGFIAIFLGGFLLSNQFVEPSFIWFFNSMCSASAPVLALFLFTRWHQRAIELTSLRDLLQLTVVYCLINALLHHFAWAILDPVQLQEPLQVAGMAVGDFLGCLIGVGLMKAAIERFGLPRGLAQPPSQD